MSNYYKGKIILKNNINFKKLKFEVDENNIICITKPLYSLSGAEGHVLCDNFLEFNKNEFQINDENSINIINRITYKFFETNLIELKIIYEKLKDENGNEFARELCTGLIFPLLSLDSRDLKYSVNFKDDYKHGSIKTDLKLRNCFDECNVYCIEDRYVNVDDLKKYSKRKKLNILVNRIEKLFKMNIFKNNINILEEKGELNKKIYYFNNNENEYIFDKNKKKILEKK